MNFPSSQLLLLYLHFLSTIVTFCSPPQHLQHLLNQQQQLHDFVNQTRQEALPGRTSSAGVELSHNLQGMTHLPAQNGQTQNGLNVVTVNDMSLSHGTTLPNSAGLRRPLSLHQNMMVTGNYGVSINPNYLNQQPIIGGLPHPLPPSTPHGVFFQQNERSRFVPPILHNNQHQHVSSLPAGAGAGMLNFQQGVALGPLFQEQQIANLLGTVPPEVKANLIQQMQSDVNNDRTVTMAVLEQQRQALNGAKNPTNI